MQLILTKDVPGLGGRGEVVEVAAGYGRNYLLPRALAIKASEGALKQAEGVRKTQEEARRREVEAARNLGQALVGTRVVVAARAGDEGKLFGSIGAADIAEAIKKFTGIEVDRRHIDVPQPIKDIGLHEIDVRPHPEVEFQVTLDVIPA